MNQPLLDFLRSERAQSLPHVNGSLLAHLAGTHRLLEKWGNPLALCDAGAAHAIYGTSGFPIMLLDVASERHKLARMVGAAAESLVYFYASCDREHVYPQLGTTAPVRFRDRFTGSVCEPEPAELAAFMELTFANELEIVLADAANAENFLRVLGPLFDRCRPMVSAGAAACFDRVRDSRSGSIG